MNCELFTHASLTYLIRYPNGFDPCKRYPTLLLLHGAGTRGRDPEVLKANPFFPIADTYPDFPFVVIAPQCWADTWFDVWEQLKSLTAMAVNLPFVDSTRFYGMGPSMGGYGTWQLAMSLPECFAAIVPICGGGMYWNAGRLKDIPVWAFHGGKDPVVFPEESKKMVDAVNAAGGNARLTVYPENMHNAWSDTYSNPEVFSWLLSHRKGTAISGSQTDYQDPTIYG